MSYESQAEEYRRHTEALRQATEARVRTFLGERSATFVIALTGDSSDDPLLRLRNEHLIEDFFSHLEEPAQYAVLTSGTRSGVSYIGTSIAKEFDMTTIGVRPASCGKYARSDPPDLLIETPDVIYGRTTFSAETPTFVNVADGAVVIGGSYGTLIETAVMMKINKSRHDAHIRDPHDSSLKKPIYICPIAGTDRVADLLVGMPLYEDLGDCFPTPRHSVETGMGAAAFITSKLPPLH